MRVETLAEGVTLYNADCRDVLPMLGKVDAVVTDPPYSEHTHAGHDAGARIGRDGGRRNKLGYQALTPQQATEFAAILAACCSGWVCWMTDHRLAPHVVKALEDAGRYVFAPLPFYAPGSRVRLSGDGPSSWTDWIVVSRTAAQHRWGTLPGGYMAREGWNDKQHMGGKPTALMRCLVRDYSREGDLVVDPFLGSGTTGVAAVGMGRRFVGCEINPEFFDASCRRIEAALKQPDMFVPAPAKPRQEALL